MFEHFESSTEGAGQSRRTACCGGAPAVFGPTWSGQAETAAAWDEPRRSSRRWSTTMI